MAPLIIAAATEIARVALPALVGKFTGAKGEQLARVVVDEAARVTGQNVGDAPHVIANRLECDPALLVEFRSRLMDHAEVLERLALDDRRDARARDVTLRAGRGVLANWRADMLALAAVLLLWRIIEALLTGGDSVQAGPLRDALMMLMGGVLALVKDVYQFEFGSSRGSREKTDQMASQGKLP